MAETESTSHRRTIEGLAEAGSTLSLGLWAGVLLMVGVTAAVSFPLMAPPPTRSVCRQRRPGHHSPLRFAEFDLLRSDALKKSRHSS